MTDLHMTARPGYTGQLNGKILERIRFLSKELDLPNLEDKFPHLKVTDGSWRKPVPVNANLADYIDHTQLKADANDAAIAQLCDEAKKFHFKAVCVNGCNVARCAKLLKGSGVHVACVCGFPLGQMTSTMKAAEAKEEVEQGAHDVDMVINIGKMKSKDYRYVFEDIKAVCDVCTAGKAVSKVILETCLLTEEEIIDGCILCVAAGATFVKTSTGFSTRGSTPEVVDIMLAVVGNAALMKAAGGVRDRSTAAQYVSAGVSRIGTSSGMGIVSKI
ncbi:putative mitochondrial deoxyribose-phosphate aldolase [Leptomonas pyrrhocoris]|uniref:deoxyribose-phosphate aldolase n=1 Tax=Leptomonas pyrrhocoris TaxID=157538 RepID=A0A0N0DY55_LEPPY|nr:putative mitochondrial deoxyribose-phosphate aldolase [Leptomonas pyrrhocoris]XP_015662171.1 putative mitochondrial deoxyribose-phosphate aldolase [Leptomonas pyrrhocoris]XP_015662172.1 putative mitochondrial deoxyribose-phosphate aldolase [Leptomonas pyrrhocoris]KPA83731.1 putative mitochondrial deoxyribose-phosphate aldolase [Leptomonas pyrrhocoris]KPA83732.1 putative mitochondrial deoxyribose-phosphate aldolase [Leptomonas pyrrhocoris]KPA83733.1 putative mitochondrial deoxyribose-phospha|eukprot:XP_015662170.1 putative mitochondrial deoxyribose-phosphate aldolase [Leptomonas pyrrhocoris]